MVDKREKVMNPAYDELALAEAMKKLQGVRTLPKMAEDTGLSVSLLGKMSACKLPSRPSKRSLKKLSDPNSHPQANITFKQLLEICGYTAEEGEVLEEIAPVGRDPRVPTPVTIENAVSLYYDGKPITLGMSMLTSMLIQNGFGPQLNIRMENGFFEIADEKADFRAVGISAFCQDKAGVEAVKLVIKTKIFDALCSEPDPVRNGERTYFILVDDMELFHYCTTTLPFFQCCDLVVLYTEDYVTFCERWSRTESAAEEAASAH